MKKSIQNVMAFRRLAVPCLAWACLALLSFSALAQKTETGANTEQTTAAVRVSSVTVQSVLMHLDSSISADVMALNHTQISAQASGTVLSIDAEVGDVVKKGATLVSLDCRLANLNLSAAQNAQNLANKEFKRIKLLQKGKVISEQQANQAQSTRDQARIRKQLAALAVTHCKVIAPFSGVVTQRQVQLGALALGGAPMLKLLQADQAELALELNQSQFNALQSADSLVFAVPNGERYAVVLRVVIPLLNGMNNKQSARFSFIGATPTVGTSGDLKWRSKDQYLPVSYVLERNDELGFFWIDDGKAKFSVLKGASLGHPALIDREYRSAQLIVEGRYGVQAGDSVKVSN